MEKIYLWSNLEKVWNPLYGQKTIDNAKQINFNGTFRLKLNSKMNAQIFLRIFFSCFYYCFFINHWLEIQFSQPCILTFVVFRSTILRHCFILIIIMILIQVFFFVSWGKRSRQLWGGGGVGLCKMSLLSSLKHKLNVFLCLRYSQPS